MPRMQRGVEYSADFTVFLSIPIAFAESEKTLKLTQPNRSITQATMQITLVLASMKWYSQAQ